MAVTVTYSLNPVGALSAGNANGALSDVGDVTTLDFSGGGFAVAHENSLLHATIEIANSAGVLTAASPIGGGPYWTAAIDQLTNGNIVAIGIDQITSAPRIQIYTATGAIATQLPFGAYPDVYTDVTRAGAGFWVAGVRAGVTSSNDIYVRMYDSAGAFGGSITVDNSGGLNSAPSIAELDNGNIAIAWERRNGANTEIHYAVYNALGAVVKASTILDNFGFINRGVSVTATNAGFAIAYEDSGWDTGTTDITLARLNSSGGFLGWTNVSNPSFSNDFSYDQGARVTRLANGLLAVSWEDNNSGTGGTTGSSNNTDVSVALLDANGVNRLAIATPANGSEDINHIAMAEFGNGHLAVLEHNVTNNTSVGQDLRVERLTIGDAGNNVLIGDYLTDSFDGGAGNDYIYGGDGADVVSGGDDNDVLFGDAGNDIVNGGSGIDYVYGGTGTNTMSGGAGVDIIISEGVNDVIYGGTNAAGAGGAGDVNYFYILTGAVAPTVWGDGAIDIYIDLSTTPVNGTYHGGGGQDYFFGGSGADTAFGDAGDDVLSGGGGNDTLNGGSGVNYSTGGAGNDTFVVNATDGILLITDFVGGGTDDTVRLLGSTFTNFAQVQSSLTALNSGMLLTVDADTQIWFLGLNATSLQASDFTFI